MLVLVASGTKNSPAFCRGAEALIAAKGDGQQQESHILWAPARRQHAGPKTGSLELELELELRPAGRLNP